MRLCPRIRYHKDGTASLHGIPASDLKSILVAASLHRYDEDAKAKDKPRDLDSAIWCKRQRIILDLTDKLDDAERIARYTYTMRPLHTLNKWQIRQRITDAKSQAAFRKRMDEILSGIRTKRVDKNSQAG